MTTTNDTALRSARAKRQGRKKHANGKEGFGETERTEASSTSLSAAGDSALDAPTTADGLMNMSADDYDAMCDADAKDVIDLLESLPATEDLPGPGADNTAIAKNFVATASGFSEVDYEACTGSWGTRAPGEGAISFIATTWDEVPASFTDPGYAVNEDQVEGTLTFEEFADGISDVDDEENVTYEFDVDFKRLAEECGDDGGQFEFMTSLQGAMDHRHDEEHNTLINNLVRDCDSASARAMLGTPVGKMFVSGALRHMRTFPDVSVTDPNFGTDVTRAVHDANWMVRNGRRPSFDELPAERRHELLLRTHTLASIAGEHLDVRPPRRPAPAVED